MVSLGTSYGQRLRRVAEVTVGVAVGVLLGDLLVYWLGSGWWQVSLVVALAMSLAFLLDGGPLLVTQAAVQSIVITTLIADPGAAFTRWTDALVGGCVALVAATVVPAAPLRRPREQASEVLRKVSELLRAAADVMVDGEVDHALELLADARATDYLIQELRAAADEGLDVVASSPFRVRHKGGLRRMVELVDPLDRSLRSTRVLVRHVAVAAYRRRPFPPSYPMVDARAGGRGRRGGRRAAGRPDGGGRAAGAARRRDGHRRGRAQRRALGGGGARPAAGRGRRPADADRDGAAGVDRRAAAATLT